MRELTFNSDTISRSPAVLFGEMADIRLHRGLYYTLSLSSGEARYAEITALAEASMDDESMVRKSEGYVDVLNSSTVISGHCRVSAQSRGGRAPGRSSGA